MTNTLLTNDIILKTALMEFDNNLVFAKTVRRDYQKNFDASTGATIRIRKPTRYIAREGSDLAVQGIQQRYTNLTIAFLDGVDVEVTSTELALQLDDFNRDIIQPAMVTLANKVDSRLYNTTTALYNSVGIAGTAPNSFPVANLAAATLTSFGIPRKDRFLLLKSFDAAALQNGCFNLFNENFNKDVILDGSMRNLAGFDVYDVQNIIRPAYSSITTSIGTPLVNGSGQSGTSLITDGWTASITGILQPGAIFTIAGVNAVNPVSRIDTGQLAHFTVDSVANSDGSGNSTLIISPEIIINGPYQNVTALPANNAALTVHTTHTKNIFYHKEAFTLAVVPLPVGANGAFQKNMMDDKAKVSLRMSRQYDINKDKDIIRFDILYGVKCFPEYGGVMEGS